MKKKKTGNPQEGFIYHNNKNPTPRAKMEEILSHTNTRVVMEAGTLITDEEKRLARLHLVP